MNGSALVGLRKRKNSTDQRKRNGLLYVGHTN